MRSKSQMLALAVTATWLIACDENHCPGANDRRDLLGDTPPMTPCKGDRVTFAPSRLSFSFGSPSAASSARSFEDETGASGEGGAGGEGSTASSSTGATVQSGSASVAADSAATVAVSVKGWNDAPRSKVLVEVFECPPNDCSLAEPNQEAQLELTPADGACSLVVQNHLRCRTDVHGNATFSVKPKENAAHDSCVCSNYTKQAEVEPGSAGGASSTASRAMRLDVSIARARAVLSAAQRVPTQRFALGCAGLDYCAASLRTASFGVRLEERGSLIYPGQPLPAIVTLSPRAGSSSTQVGWLSATSCDTANRPRSLEISFTPTEPVIQLQACVNGVAGEYEINAQLRQAQAQQPSRTTLVVEADPVVVDVHGLTPCEAEGAAGAGGSPGAGGAGSTECGAQLGFRDCAGNELQRLENVSTSATLLLSSDDLAFLPTPFRSIPLSRGAEPMSLPVDDADLPASPRVDGVLSGSVLQGADRCGWTLEASGTE